MTLACLQLRLQPASAADQTNLTKMELNVNEKEQVIMIGNYCSSYAAKTSTKTLLALVR